jgi:hypothetical protein
MSLETGRTYKDLTICTIGSENAIARLRNVRDASDVDAIEFRAGTQNRPWFKAGYITQVLSGEAFMTTVYFKAAIGTHVTYTHDIGGKSEAGTALLTRREGSWATGDPEGETFELRICGTPSLAA